MALGRLFELTKSSELEPTTFKNGGFWQIAIMAFEDTPCKNGAYFDGCDEG